MINYNFSLVKETDDDKANYYNEAAAHQRRQTINEQIEEFFKRGGEIKKLPAYDEKGGKHEH